MISLARARAAQGDCGDCAGACFNIGHCYTSTLASEYNYLDSLREEAPPERALAD